MGSGIRSYASCIIIACQIFFISEGIRLFYTLDCIDQKMDLALEEQDSVLHIYDLKDAEREGTITTSEAAELNTWRIEWSSPALTNIAINN